MALPYCCVVAEFDGFTAEEHARVCLEPRPETESESDDGGLFPAPDQTKQGGQHL